VSVADEQGASGVAARLRQLRAHGLSRPVTQGQLAKALGVSTPTISAWENGTQIPPEDRLRSLALFFATPRSLEGPRLLDVAALSKDEESVRRSLIDELVRLREAHTAPPARRQTGALGGRFYYFPDGLPVRIIGSQLSPYEVLPSPLTPQVAEAARRLRRLLATSAPPGIEEALDELDRFVGVSDVLRELVDRAERGGYNVGESDWRLLVRAFKGGGVQYADPGHPNGIESLWHGDMDAVIELTGHIRAENPGSDVRWLLETSVSADDLGGGHLVILGTGATFGEAGKSGLVLDYLRRRLNLPVSAAFRADDPEYGGSFIVTLDERGSPDIDGGEREEHFPRFLQDGMERIVEHGQPVLEYDVALIARFPNPLNLAGTVTICTGVFSRGTYGAVRALTDSHLRARNEKYLDEHLDITNFWMLMHVPVLTASTGAQTMTPDLTRPFHRLRTSS
jgi:transcriptional regulator with XRE-family HTH domain